MILVPCDAEWMRQPSALTKVDWGNPLTRGLRFAFNGAHWRDAVTGVLASAVNAPTLRATPDGIATAFTAAAANYLSFPDNDAWDITGDITVLWAGGFNATGGAFRTLISKSGGGGGTNNPFDLYLTSVTGAPRVVRANASGSSTQELQTTIPTTGVQQYICWHDDGNPATTGSGWVNGTSQTVGLITTAATSVTGNAAALRIGQREGAGTQLDGWVNYVFIFARRLSERERLALKANPWQVFEPATETIWVPVSGGGATYTATTSLAAAIQQAAALTAGLSAAAQTTATLSATASAAVQAAQAAQATLDAAVQTAASAAASVQAAVQATGTTTTSLNAALQAARTAAAVLDLAVQQQGAQTASLSAQVQHTPTASASLDAFVQAGSTLTTNLAAAVLREALASAGLDLAVQVPSAATTGLSAALQLARTAATALDAAVQEVRTRSSSLSAQIQSGTSATALIDVAVQAVVSTVTGVQAAVAEAASTTLALGAAVMVQRSLAAAMEVAVQAAASRQAGVSAYVEDQSGNVFFTPAADRTVIVEPESRVCAIGAERRVLVIT